MGKTKIQLQWMAGTALQQVRTGVSLHSHTLHSRESLDCIYPVAEASAPLRAALRYGERRYREAHGVELDLRQGWWTPPLGPMDAFRVEAQQIETLGLAPLVSLTDHDDIEAPMSVQAVNPGLAVPVSVEWTVPYGPTFFHLGVHNLPAGEARAIMARLAEFTESPDERKLPEILESFDLSPQVLLVFNHPLWDEKGIGNGLHRAAAVDFLTHYGSSIHAIEINGLRPWTENRLAISLAGEWRKPVVSGGDRHAVEPNALLNLTNAASFSEFVSEVRGGSSSVLVMTHYRQSNTMRLVHNILEVLQPFENHCFGWRDWPDRVFYQGHDGIARSLRQLWGERPPASARVFDGLLRLAGHGSVRNAVKSAYSTAERVLL